MGIFDFIKEKNDLQKIIDTNIRLSKKYNFTPELFGCSKIDETFVERVKAFQTKYNLVVDGLVGDATFRRRNTEKEALEVYISSTHPKKVIWYNNKSFPIEWGKIITFKDKDGFVAPEGSYQKVLLNRKPNMFVLHHDVCISSKSCFDVLKQRGLSVAFLIDNDGTIYQTLDLKHVAYHAKGVNSKSIGVEISNAFYLKFQETYEKMGLGKRPVITDAVVHGKKIEPHLGFYPIQVEALKALIKAVNNACGIEIKTPTTKGVVQEVANGSYNGVVHHYQITELKIDSCCLDLTKVIEEIK